MRYWPLCAVLTLTGCGPASFVRDTEGNDGSASPPAPLPDRDADQIVAQDSGRDAALDASLDASADAGEDASADASADAGPPPCDLTKLPTEDTCVVDEAAGVFVSSSLGSAQGNGSRAKPYATIQAGIAAAKIAQRRVYACAENYAEALTLAESVSVFGYFDCAAAWKIVQKRAIVLSPTSPAGFAKDLVKATHVEAIELVAPDVGVASASSIGLVAVGSSGLELANVRLHGGKAGNGADGAAGVQLTDSGAGKNGAQVSGNYTCNPNWQVSCAIGPVVLATTNTCTGKPNINPGPGGTTGEPGHMISEFDGSFSYQWYVKAKAGPGGAQPANAATALGGVDGQSAAVAGQAGAAGSDGAPAGNIGTFSLAGTYVPASANTGSDGAPGQGGGAGAGHMNASPGVDANSHQGYYFWGARGGGGGAGGCPGLAGGVGTSGGASVGLVAISSGLKLTSSTVESSAGGAGGKSGMPSMPLLGGDGGVTNGFAQVGAMGGQGGYPGVSGNGAGGPSLALAYSALLPTVVSTTLTPGAGGAGVSVRTFGPLTVPASPAGKSATTHSF